MNPTMLLGVVAAWVASVLVAGWLAYSAGQNAEIAARSREVKVEADVIAKVEQGIANAVPKIQVKNTTIRQTLEKEVHERPVYRDCVADPAARRLLNDTIGTAPAGSAPGAGQLSASGPAR